MSLENYKRLYELETTPEALEATCRYLVERFRKFLKKNEPVLICFPDDGPESFGHLAARAVRACEAEPIFWGPDYRWKNLLWQAFQTHAETIIASPWMILGLTKLSRFTNTPLYVNDVVLGGYPYAKWMVEGVKKGLDCRVWGCYAIRSGPVVAGFTCNQEAGIHIRDDVLDAVIVDERGPVPRGSRRGKFLMVSRKDKNLIYDPEETSILMHQPCSCGLDSPRIIDVIYTGETDFSAHMLEEKLLPWSSILEFRSTVTESGVDLEVVTFPGTPLPALPSCAKLTVRAWNPEEDVPMCIQDLFPKKFEKNSDTH